MHTEGKYNKFHVNKTQRSGRTVITAINSWRGAVEGGRGERYLISSRKQILMVSTTD